MEIVKNFKFHQRKQKESEAVKDFMATLRKLSLHCNFGDYLTTALRNQLVFGLACKRTQARLLESKELDLDKALRIATTMELSEKGTQELQGNSAIINVASVKKNSRIKKNYVKKQEAGGNTTVTPKAQTSKSNNLSINIKIKCYRCGKGHLASKCALNPNIRCNVCGKAGHLQRVCFQGKQSTNQLEEVLNLNTDVSQARAKIRTRLQVNQRTVDFKIDTGAAVSIIDIENARKLFPGLTIHKTDLTLRSFCNKEIKVLGRIVVKVICRSKQNSLDLFLTPGEREPLLGREWFHQLQHISEIAEIYQKCVSFHTVENTRESKVAQLIANYEKGIELENSKIVGL